MVGFRRLGSEDTNNFVLRPSRSRSSTIWAWAPDIPEGINTAATAYDNTLRPRFHVNNLALGKAFEGKNACKFARSIGTIMFNPMGLGMHKLRLLSEVRPRPGTGQHIPQTDEVHTLYVAKIP